MHGIHADTGAVHAHCLLRHLLHLLFSGLWLQDGVIDEGGHTLAPHGLCLQLQSGLGEAHGTHCASCSKRSLTAPAQEGKALSQKAVHLAEQLLSVLQAS